MLTSCMIVTVNENSLISRTPEHHLCNEDVSVFCCARNEWGPPERKVDTRKYRAEPKSIFEYEPGKSSILEHERPVSIFKTIFPLITSNKFSLFSLSIVFKFLSIELPQIVSTMYLSPSEPCLIWYVSRIFLLH